MTQPINPQWAQEIRQKAKALLEDEEHVHNNVLHKQILATWKAHSPKMWARLQAASLTGPLATVLQARMWDRQEELLKQGVPVTDAREVAEREHLMLEPEAEAADAQTRLP